MPPKTTAKKITVKATTKATAKTKSGDKATDDVSEETVEETVEDNKTDSKTAAGKGAGSKGKGKSKGASADKETSAKTTEENARYSAAIATCVASEYITDFQHINAKTFQEKCASSLTLYVLEAIDDFRKAEVLVNKHALSDPYPSDGYFNTEDKLNGTVSKKKPVNTGKDADVVSKQKSALPRKKGQIIDEPVEADEKAEPEAVDETEETVEVTTEAEANVKAPVKKNVTQINKNGKAWLMYIVNKFTDEIYSTVGGKNIKNDADFAAFAFKTVSKDFDAQICRTIIPTVERLGTSVANMKDHDFSKYLTSKIGDIFDKDRRPLLTAYVVKYLVAYYKLIAVTISHHLIGSHKGINDKSIEAAMRNLDLGNNAYLIQTGICKADERDYGLSCGIAFYARQVNLILNPPMSEEEKKERNDKRQSSKGKNATATKKKAPAKRGKKAAKVEVEVDEVEVDEADADAEEADAAEEETEEVEVDEVEADAAEVDEEETEEVEVDAEADAEDEEEDTTPAPPKQVKKIVNASK